MQNEVVEFEPGCDLPPGFLCKMNSRHSREFILHKKSPASRWRGFDYSTLIVSPVHVNDTGNTQLDTDDTRLDTAMQLRFRNGATSSVQPLLRKCYF